MTLRAMLFLPSRAVGRGRGHVAGVASVEDLGVDLDDVAGVASVDLDDVAGVASVDLDDVRRRRLAAIGLVGYAGARRGRDARRGSEPAGQKLPARLASPGSVVQTGRRLNVKPATFYGQIVGQVIRGRRELGGMSLATMSQTLALASPSGWSRVETGDTAMTVAQLRKAARTLGMAPAEVVRQADALVTQLEARGVVVHDDKPKDIGKWVLGGAGILALLAGASKKGSKTPGDDEEKRGRSGLCASSGKSPRGSGPMNPTKEGARAEDPPRVR